MKKILIGFMLLGCTFSVMAQNVPSDLAQCVADSTTGKDRKDLVRWFVAAMGKHPAMADLNSVTEPQLEALNKSAASVYERLLTKDCAKEVRAAYKRGGTNAVRVGFEYLGRVAMQELMIDPNVTRVMASLATFLDPKKMQKILEE